MAESAGESSGAHRILIADDEPHIRRILTALFESANIDVDVADDGDAALHRLEDPALEYDLMILDLVMPGRSGLEVLERVAELPHLAHVPVVILTAKGQDADRERAFALGAAEFVTKPFSPNKLLARVRHLLDR